MKKGLPTSVLITSDSVGDIWTYSRVLAEGLSALGVRVALATFGPALAPLQKEGLRAHGVQLYESPYEVESLPCFRAEIEKSADWLLGLEEDFDPEIVHLNGPIHAALPWRRPTVVMVHRCLPAWCESVRGTSLPKQWDVYHHRVEAGLRSAGMVAVSTEQTLRELRQYHGKFVTGRVIPYGWSSAEVRGTKHRGFIFTAAGVWDEGYSLRALEVAAPFAIWPVFCAGQAVTPRGERRPRPDVKNVCCLGELNEDELEGWLESCSIFFQPSLHSYGQMSILKAASKGCPLVLGDHPALRELWGDCALFVPADDPQAIRVTLERLVMDEGKRHNLGKRARERAGELSVAAMLASYCTAYRDLLTSRLPKRQVLSHAVVGA